MRGFIFLVVILACLMLSEEEIIKITNLAKDGNEEMTGNDIRQPPTQRSSTNNDDQLWLSPVPYVLDSSLDMNARGVIVRALDQFRLKSCIDFKARDSETYYIKARKLSGCFSYIGLVIADGQDLSIGQYCDEISTVEHEFLHALGFYHEQSRYDRDNYVTIQFKNIQEGFEGNFNKVGSESSTTSGISYDYLSVMHYGKNFFTNGNGTTIITKDPAFQEVIGQRFGMSPSDVLELNLRYGCNSTIAFMMYCGFSDSTTCRMNTCANGGRGWELTSSVAAGPTSDHTGLPGGNGASTGQAGDFMHATTETGEEGDSALLETERMSPKRECNVQCLQFYYYHSGNESDKLNIWIREFEDEYDVKGSVRLMGQITGPPKDHWQLKHVSLNATKSFQVEFEARKGAGISKGGFSIDDINLSEIECPHVTIQIDNFETVLKSSPYGTAVYSPRQYSSGGYSYRVGVVLYNSFFGLFVQLLSGKNDDDLEFPVPRRQVSFKMVDQRPEILLHMSKERSITSDLSESSTGALNWGNPRMGGTPFVDENNETIYKGDPLGVDFFALLEDMRPREYLKGGSAVFAFSFQDLTPLVNGSTLPCPELKQVPLTHPSDRDDGPCSATTTPPTTMDPPEKTTDKTPLPTTMNPPEKTTDKIHPTTPYPPIPTDDRTPPPTGYPPRTTDDRIHPTTYRPPRTTDDRVHPTTHRPPRTTDDKIHPTTPPCHKTTDDDRIHPTTHAPPTTTDDSIFGFSPGLLSSPVLTFLLALMLLIH